VSAAPDVTALAPRPAPVEPAPVVPAPTRALDPAIYTADAPPFSPAVLEILAAEPDPDAVEERDGGGGRMLLYVPWIHYQRVLVKAFGPGGFRMVPTAPARVEGNVMTYKGALLVRAPGQATFQFVGEAKGECGMRGGMSSANAEEGAMSDCLVKCCKRLSIYDHLWDPNWRRAWEKHHAGKKHAQVKSAPWPSAAPASGSAPPSSATIAAPSSNGPAAAAVEPDEGERDRRGMPSDPGLPATGEQKAAIVSELKAKKWKTGFLRIWMGEVFGIHLTADEAKRAPEALSQNQADAALTLLIAHGTPMYDRLLARWRDTGSLRDGEA
jgi:hypothetical protein